MTCDKCSKKISILDIYYEIEKWEMKDGEGVEIGHARICDDCKLKLDEFLNS